MKKVYLGIGSNLADKKSNIQTAIKKIENEIGRVRRVSSFFYSEPMGFQSENNFVNVVVEVLTNLTPEKLLKKNQQIEQKMGRIKPLGVRYADRIIDIDILAYENVIINTRDLEIPHSKMLERDFVLIPFAEISPNYIHPKEKKTIKELAENLHSTN